MGKVTGKITFAGELPKIRKFNLATYPDPYYCGRISDGKGWRIGHKSTVSSDSGFEGAIIFMKDIKPLKNTKPSTHSIKSLDCRFTPFISLFRQGDVVSFENWDPVPHQIEVFQSTSKGGRLLVKGNLQSHPETFKSDFLQAGAVGTQQPGPPLYYDIKNEGILFFRCPIHEYMEAWVLSLDHHFVAISGDGGKFSITGIPIGAHTLVVWHPIGRTEQTVTIRDQETIHVNVQFTPSRSSFYREPEVKTNPFGIELLGDSHIVPSVELQTE